MMYYGKTGYQIPYYNPHRHSKFPEDMIVKDRDHAAGHTTYYVFIGKKLVRVKRAYGSGPHYQTVRNLKENYDQDLDGPKKHWNPLDYRIDEEKQGIPVPAQFVEMKRHEAKYA